MISRDRRRECDVMREAESLAAAHFNIETILHTLGCAPSSRPCVAPPFQPCAGAARPGNAGASIATRGWALSFSYVDRSTNSWHTM